MTGISWTISTVRMKSPTQGSDPKQALSDVDEFAGEHASGSCTSIRRSSATSRGSIFRSPSSPAMNVNDSKMN
jgi:hypothetical protein